MRRAGTGWTGHRWRGGGWARTLTLLLLLGPPLSGCATVDGAGEQEVALAASVPTVDLPFTLDRNRIVVEARLNGTGGFPLLFDTGLTDAHLLTPRTLERLGLVPGGGGDGFDSAGRRFRLQEATLDLLGIGPLDLAGERVAVAPIPPAAAELGWGAEVAGVLGDRLLEVFAAVIDFERRLLRLTGTPPPPGRHAAVLPLEWRGNLLITRLEANGRELELMVDTGDFGTLTLFPDAAEQTGVRPVAGPEGMRTVLGAAGPFTVRRAVLPSLTMDRLRTEKLEVVIGPRGEGTPRWLAGRVGTGLLSNFRVVLHPAGGRLVLEPRRMVAGTQAPPTTVLPRRRAGTEAFHSFQLAREDAPDRAAPAPLPPGTTSPLRQASEQ